jgi:hypothetical protein
MLTDEEWAQLSANEKADQLRHALLQMIRHIDGIGDKVNRLQQKLAAPPQAGDTGTAE